jgi:hypothetical protein
MASLSRWHTELANGVGKCSVPMWMDGCPAGFCDEPAYGPQLPDQTRYGEWGRVWIGGRWCSSGIFMPAYCSGLACPKHGGPEKMESED